MDFDFSGPDKIVLEKLKAFNEEVSEMFNHIIRVLLCLPKYKYANFSIYAQAAYICVLVKWNVTPLLGDFGGSVERLQK